MFGGLLREIEESLGDTWSYDYNTNSWAEMNPVISPSPRWGASLVYDSESDIVILFGGKSNGEDVSPETWSYDYNTNTWINMDPSIQPSSRNEFDMVYDSKSDRCILFGGTSADGSHSDETWSYDYNTNTWTNLHPLNSPPKKKAHGMAYDVESDRIILFGGHHGGYESETWIYDYNTSSWTYQHTSLNPSKRAVFAIVYDIQSDRIVLMGGSHLPLLFYSDTWVYDYNSNTWSNMNSTLSPSGRTASDMVYDSESDRAILFGGWVENGDTVNDIWSYDLNSNTWKK
jgi:N-acetylneuraminic acid mutarotase